MLLETERLFIRNVLPEDADDLYPIRHSQFVMKHNCMAPLSLEVLRDRLSKKMKEDSWLHIVLKETGKVIGSIGVEDDDIRYMVDAVMIDYFIGEEYARKGYMTEALTELMRYLFEERKIELISARVFGENAASEALLKKLGFVHEGTLRKGVRTRDGAVHMDKLFSIMEEEYCAE